MSREGANDMIGLLALVMSPEPLLRDPGNVSTHTNQLLSMDGPVQMQVQLRELFADLTLSGLTDSNSREMNLLIQQKIRDFFEKFVDSTRDVGQRLVQHMGWSYTRIVDNASADIALFVQLME